MDDMTGSLPEAIADVETLDELLSRPTPGVVERVRRMEGNLLVLGVAGKMGPTLARMAVRAARAADAPLRVYGVSRFSDAAARRSLEGWGVETIACDLMDEAALLDLPDADYIVYMVGTKFGASQQQGLTWAVNAYLPGVLARRFPRARWMAFSSGNVYPFVPSGSGGCTERTPPDPVGEYAQSVLGRERVLSHFAQAQGTPMLLLRLNYAAELRYGVLLDVAQRVWQGEPVDLEMGYANVIWQGDANAVALQALELADVPAAVLNVTGPEVLSVRRLALEFGILLGVEPVLAGEEAPDALLNDAGRAFSLYGYPSVPVGRLVRWVAEWVRAGGPTLDKPTKFQVRDGRF